MIVPLLPGEVWTISLLVVGHIVVDSTERKKVLNLLALSSYLPVAKDRLHGVGFLVLENLNDSIVIGIHTEVTCNLHGPLGDVFGI